MPPPTLFPAGAGSSFTGFASSTWWVPGGESVSLSASGIFGWTLPLPTATVPSACGCFPFGVCSDPVRPRSGLRCWLPLLSDRLSLGALGGLPVCLGVLPPGGPPWTGLTWPEPPLLCLPTLLTLVRPHFLCPLGGVALPWGGVLVGPVYPPGGVPPLFGHGPPQGGYNPAPSRVAGSRRSGGNAQGGGAPRGSPRAWAAPLMLWGRVIKSGTGGDG